MFSKIFNRVLFYVQILLIAIYLILEEIVWDRFAEPIFRYIKYLKFFEKIEELLSGANRYVVLALFLLPFVIGELLGVFSAVVAVKGYVVFAIILYILKLLIAAFAFWLFNVEKQKLLSFWIINYSYIKITQFSIWIKTTQAFKSIKRVIGKVKILIKIKYANFKTFIKRYIK